METGRVVLITSPMKRVYTRESWIPKSVRNSRGWHLCQKSVLGSKRTVWVIAPGEGGKEWENFQSESIASIGWNETGDLSGLEDKKAFQEVVAESHPESGAQKVGKMLHDFAVRMQEGDLIFAKAGTKAILGWGIVSSDYQYDENATPHDIRTRGPMEGRFEV